jgi:hypothetical protein
MAKPRRRRALLVLVLLALVTGGWLWAAYRGSGERLPPGTYDAHMDPHWTVPPGREEEIRADALARAQVWREPAVAVEKADLAKNAGDDHPLDPARLLSCKFLPKSVSGTTPKFDCVLEGGEVVKVKYGGSAEVYGEVAASRLLAALGFGADRMALLERVRCFGCPYSPFRTYQMLELARVDGAYTDRIDYDRHVDFSWVSVERRFPGSSIDTPDTKGWAFFELEKIDPARGGAPRAHVDALRLMAVLMHHWDNKSENQRLVCLSDPGAAAECPRPFAFVQDVGATFGPSKIDFGRWSARPVFNDPDSCAVDMKDLPFEGATFAPVVIGEDGRRFLADRLTRLSDAQLAALFTAAGFPRYHKGRGPGADVSAWVAAFRGKVEAIASRTCAR